MGEFLKMINTKQLIQELKEKIDNEPTINKSTYLQGQLNSVEKLIKSIKEDIEQDKVIPDFVKAHLKIKLNELLE